MINIKNRMAKTILFFLYFSISLKLLPNLLCQVYQKIKFRDYVLDNIKVKFQQLPDM
ncbi:hypothetical protein PEPMIC_01012 [Parvimonas micra ATCC 33270]|uniref:Uncharacterized protein n=1 Tax=Parvimonas micra ATCC 33270 TaxID=411465 RepID=A8SLI5_9FIRM|nr:hypothetical protein PEPMIC_01012 [Parvimonas micra ATCC 33270]